MNNGQYHKYASSVSLERFLETEYRQRVKMHAERQFQAQQEKAKAFAERQSQAKVRAAEEAEAAARAEILRQEREARKSQNGAQARTDFEALGKEMAKATTREERVELGRKRAELAPQTGISYVYKNHCWKCGEGISSDIHAQCPSCRFYICSCGACFCHDLNAELIF